MTLHSVFTYRGLYIYILLLFLVIHCQKHHSNKISPKVSMHQLERFQNTSFSESPLLKQYVETDLLPPVQNRLPKNPELIQPIETVGEYGGTLRLGAYEHLELQTYIGMIGYENLVRWDAHWKKIIPNIAQSFVVDDSMKIYKFYLRKGMCWSDGKPFTANDILFWYQQILLNPKLNRYMPAFFHTNQLKQVKLKNLDEIHFEFHRPAPYFMHYLAHPEASIITAWPGHFFKNNKNEFSDAAIFKKINKIFSHHYANGLINLWKIPNLPTLHAWIPARNRKDHLFFSRNPYYWKIDIEFHQLPYLDTLEIQLFHSSKEMIQATTNAKLHIIDRFLDPLRFIGDISHSRAMDRYYDFQMIPNESNIMVLGFNLCHKDSIKRRFFQNKTFRIALSQAINRNRIVRNLFNENGKIQQVAPRPDSKYYHPKLATQYTEYNINLSLSYLKQLGLQKSERTGNLLLPDGEPLSICFVYDNHHPNAFYWQEIISYIQKDWVELGIALVAQPLSCTDLSEKMFQANFDGFITAGNGGGGDVIMGMDFYIPGSSKAYNALSRNSRNKSDIHDGPKPPHLYQKQFALYDSLMTSLDEDMRTIYVKRILDLSAEIFYVMGICILEDGIGWVRNDCYNVLSVMPHAWSYPTPGPGNPCQYFLKSF